MTSIELQGIGKSYPSRGGRGDGRRVDALRDVTLRAEPGQVLWVRAPSGGGKSTLLNILGLLTTPTRGSYRLGGEDVAAAPPRRLEQLRSSVVTTIFQRGNLFPHLTPTENVLLGGTSATTVGEAVRALDRVGLADRAEERAGVLSGGEQQRVAIARALARDSTVVLADEPVASLDEGNADAVLDLLSGCARDGALVVVASHDDAVARIATDRHDLGGRS